MPGTPHEVLIVALRDRPALLAELVKRVDGRSLGEATGIVDATLRFTKAIEVRPDLIVRTRHAGRARWAMVEVQNAIDERKRISWPLAVSLLVHQEKAMGEVLVLTASRRVAAWAARVAHLRGDLGTRFTLTPRILLLAGRRLEALLDPAHPELALFAAWAMQKRRGPEARQVVLRALKLTELLPKPLQDAQVRAILATLSKPMLALLQEMSMDVRKIPETPASRKVWLQIKKGRELSKKEGKREGKLEGKQEALLAVLAARGLPLTEADRARITACVQAAKLNRWIEQAATATSMQEVFAAKPARVTLRAPAKVLARSAKAPAGTARSAGSRGRKSRAKTKAKAG